jgi:hypothetical protein
MSLNAWAAAWGKSWGVSWGYQESAEQAEPTVGSHAAGLKPRRRRARRLPLLPPSQAIVVDLEDEELTLQLMGMI